MDWQNTVTNLLLKAQDPATTEEERKALSEKAAYLMAKYGITTLLEHPANQPLNIVNVELALGAPYAKLRATLIHRISLAFDCKSVRNVKTKTVRVFGLQADIDNFKQMFASLWIQALFAVQLSDKPAYVHGKTHNHSYLLGFIDEVSARVASATARAKSDAHTSTVSTVSTALVFKKRENAIADTISAIYPSLRTSAGSVASSNSSYGAGVTAGRRADINQPRMGGSQQTTRKALS